MKSGAPRAGGAFMLGVAALVLTLILPATSAAELVETCFGTVIDTRGKPIEGATVSVYKWHNYDGRFVLDGRTTTSKRGAFCIPISTWANGATYWYVTASHPGQRTARLPAWDGSTATLWTSGTYCDYRCVDCADPARTIVLSR